MRARFLLALTACGLFLLLIGVEWIEEGESFGWRDLVVELAEKGLLVGTVVAVALLVLRFREQEERTEDLASEVARIAARSETWRRAAAADLAGLARAIDRQLALWGLTPAEREVALLLLKGFGHKEIARLRATSETTIRQQAAAIYRKADLSGRAALQAYFLEGLFLPERPGTEPGAIAKGGR